MPAMSPDGLVFGLLGNVPALLVVIRPGAADDTTVMTAVGCRAGTATLVFGFRLGFPADLVGVLESALFEIARGIASRFAEDVGQNVGTVGRESLAGNRVVPETFDEFAVRLLEPLWVFG